MAGSVLSAAVRASYSALTRARWLSTSSVIWQQSVQVVVSQDKRKLTLQCEGEHERRFHGIWLRHNCRCPVCYSHNDNMSRVSYKQLDGVELVSAHVKGDQVIIEWILQDGSTHSGCLPVTWLKDNDYSLPESFTRKQQEAKPLVASTLPRMEFDEMRSSDEGAFSWLKQINHYGISLVVGVASHDELVETIRARVPHLQPTIYGETYFIKHVKNPAVVDLGYSTEELLFHQDLLFYESPPGIQLLHCVKFDECVEGGESILLDTYPVVEELRRTHPKQFDTLTRVPVTFQKVSYEPTGASDLKITRHHIELDSHGEITAVNWNPHHMDPLFIPEDQIEEYYAAHLTLAKIFTNHPSRITHRLRPGEALFYNNRRVMHARNSFQLNGGVREFMGLYVNIDYLRSEFLVLSQRLGKGETSKNVFIHNA